MRKHIFPIALLLYFSTIEKTSFCMLPQVQEKNFLSHRKKKHLNTQIKNFLYHIKKKEGSKEKNLVFKINKNNADLEEEQFLFMNFDYENN